MNARNWWLRAAAEVPMQVVFGAVYAHGASSAPVVAVSWLEPRRGDSGVQDRTPSSFSAWQPFDGNLWMNRSG
jgi:hypothetical protein